MFEAFPKIPRLSREIIITEKLDGTNAQIWIEPEIMHLEVKNISATVDGMAIMAGSRNRLITVGNDNHGFAAWVADNAEELVKLGPGRHYGEWWGRGIGRGYGLDHKRFSLFNASRWYDTHYGESLAGPPDGASPAPECCHVVPTLYRGPFDTHNIEIVLNSLRDNGSVAAPGFMNPEGIIIYHTQGNLLFKKTITDDEKGKGYGA